MNPEGMAVVGTGCASGLGRATAALFAASKAGVAGMTLPVTRDIAQHRVRVCTIAPGIFLTPMLMGVPQVAQDSLGTQVPHPSRPGSASRKSLPSW